MKFITPSIAWNFEIEPIHSIDFHPTRPELAVAGTDSTGENIFLRTWIFHSERLTCDENSRSIVDLKSEMKMVHSQCINIVRFSPQGTFIATGSDDAKIIILEEKYRPKCFGVSEMTWNWGESKIFSGHSKEVYHISWFRDEKYIASSSHDFSVIIWDIKKSRMLQRFDGPTGYVKFVAVDPLSKFVAFFSCDRTLRVYKSSKTKKSIFNIKHCVRKSCGYDLTEEESSDQEEVKKKNELKENENKPEPKATDFLFLPDNFRESIFLRGEWSPDGSLLLVPRAQIQKDEAPSLSVGAYIFSRSDLTVPALFYPLDEPVNIARFCPKFLKTKNDKIFDSDFVFIFALCTYNSIYLYSTNSLYPLMKLQSIHYASITDIAWISSSHLLCSSMDGFITFVVLDKIEGHFDTAIEGYLNRNS